MREIGAEKFTTDDKKRQWHPEGDQGKKTETEYSKKKTSNTLGQLSKMKALNRRFFQGLHKPLKFLQS